MQHENTREARATACSSLLSKGSVANVQRGQRLMIAGLLRDQEEVKAVLLRFPAWWTRPAARLEQVAAHYERLGFSMDTIRFIFTGACTNSCLSRRSQSVSVLAPVHVRSHTLDDFGQSPSTVHMQQGMS